MDIAEVREEGLKLQDQIRAQVQALVNDFQNRTGIGVADVQIRMADVTTYSSGFVFMVTGAEIKLDIFRTP